MTVFLALAKRVITDKANAICRASSAADTSLASQAMRFIAPSARNDELSARKRNLIITSLAQLDTIDEHQSDASSFVELIAMLKSWVRQEEAISTEFGYGRGETEAGLENLEALLQGIFDKLSEVRLIDISIGTDPLAIVRHSFAEYYIGTITLLRDPSYVVRATMNPSISSKIAFATAQQALVTEALQQCLRHMNLLDTARAHPYYLTNTKEIILFILKSLREKNEALRLSHSKGIIPGVAAIIQVDSGILDRCLQAAEAEILGPKALHLQAMPFDEFEEYADPLGAARVTTRTHLISSRYKDSTHASWTDDDAIPLVAESSTSSSAGEVALPTELKPSTAAARTAASVQALTSSKDRKKPRGADSSLAVSSTATLVTSSIKA